jgi:hypothetical protein
MGGTRKRQKLHVVKVAGNYNLEFRAANWSDMPILYMELLENKAKVKPECRNIDYEPSGYDMNSFPNFAQARMNALEETKKDIEGGDDYQPNLNLTLPSYQSYNPQPVQSKGYSTPRIPTPISVITKPTTPPITIHNDIRPISELQTTTVSLAAALSNNPPPPIIQPQPQTQPQVQPLQQTSISYYNKESQEYSDTDYLYNDSKSENKDDTKDEDSSILSILRGSDSKNQNEQTILDINLASIPQTNYSYPPSTPKQNITINSSIPIPPQQKLYPSLSEISSGNIRPGNRDLTFMNKNDEKEIQRKRELLFKFKTLRRHYSDVNIPEFSELSDLAMMEREYDTLVRQLRIDSNVENYKKYLIVGFGLVEFVLSKFLKFTDIDGFTQQQLLGMNQYEKILLELGEKYQVEPSKQWSPELRLIGIIAMNAIIFVGTKMLFKSASSSDILNLITTPASSNKPKTQPASTKTQSNTSSSSSKGSSSTMSGPTIDPEDLE